MSTVDPSPAAAPVRLLPRAAPAGNLPVALTSFVGRERELTALPAALTATRLLTVTGPGGCGKTRLAREVAATVWEDFPDGVWWVELAAVTDGSLVGAALAEAIGVRPMPGTTDLQAACAYLAPRRALVVLDNCEHVLGACAEVVTAVLKAAARVAVLATSRATLAVDGETDWRIPPLSPPDAAALFVERARKARPDFAATEQLAAVCERLDGLPLAIELAAARVRMLSVEQIAERLSDRFALLTSGPRTAIERQQTLRASVDWSYELLSEDEQRLLRRVGVFAGGFTLGAAEAVCDGTLDQLAALVDQSLVIAEPHGDGMRYRLLETVREYALARLEEAGEADLVRDRHRDRFVALAVEAAPHFESRHAGEWTARLDPEAANVAAALEHALRTDPPAALRLAGSLYTFWRSRGRLAEAERAQTRSLAAGRDADPGLRARVLLVRSNRSVAQGDPAAAQTYATEALALATEAGDTSLAARARRALGDGMQFSRPAAARTEFARAAELARAAGDDWALITCHQTLAFGAMLQNDHARGLGLIAEVADLTEQLGEPVQLARHAFFVGWGAVNDGRLEGARDAAARVREALAEVREPVFWAMADGLDALADVWAGSPELVLERVPGQLERAVRLGAGMTVPLLMSALGFAQLAAGRLDEARSQLEAMAALVEGRNGFATAWALNFIAEVQRLRRDDAAEATATRAQAAGEQIGNRLLATRGRLTLARLAAAEGDVVAARRHALAHLDAIADGGHRTWMPGCFDALGEIAAASGEADDAARLFAAAGRARSDIGVARVIPEPEHWAAIEANLPTAPPLPLDEALAWARRSRGSRARPAAGWHSLTPTELKVAELVAQGLTNRQIAEQMFISPATVKTHLDHAFSKLDVRNRAELAALHARHG